jgi:hypothetical protein
MGSNGDKFWCWVSRTKAGVALVLSMVTLVITGTVWLITLEDKAEDGLEKVKEVKKAYEEHCRKQNISQEKTSMELNRMNVQQQIVITNQEHFREEQKSQRKMLDRIYEKVK